MKSIMKLCVIAMPLAGESLYSAQSQRAQIPICQEALDQYLKNIKETNDRRAQALYKIAVENFMSEGKHVPTRYLKHVDQETFTRAQQHNQKLFEELQR